MSNIEKILGVLILVLAFLALASCIHSYRLAQAWAEDCKAIAMIQRVDRTTGEASTTLECEHQ